MKFLKNNFKIIFWLILGLIILILLASSCAPRAAPEEAAAPRSTEAVIQESETSAEEAYREPAEEGVGLEPAPEEAMQEPAAEAEDAAVFAATATPAVQATSLPSATPLASPAPTQLILTPTPLVEPRVVELEWPDRIHLGDSDVIRLAIIPTEGGYAVTTEFPDHQTITQDVPVVRPSGYDLFAVARLEGVKFDLSPSGEQAYHLPEGDPVTWHWSLTPRQPGHHRLTITLSIRWVPLPGSEGSTREAVAYSKGLDVYVPSILGLTRGQAMTTGLFGFIFGSVISVLGILRKPRRQPLPIRIQQPNPKVRIELPAKLNLQATETSLLQTLFSSYARITIQREFRSGYSGARTFLVLPVRADGRADAHTIAKIGRKSAIQREYENFETFVKHTLPPVTARIQNPPVRIKKGSTAALQYTFIGEPGNVPSSLRESLLANPDSGLLEKLFETFGPNWWTQRNAHTFRLGQEYDRLLTPHLVLAPEHGRFDQILNGQTQLAPGQIPFGTVLSLRNFPHKERKDGYISLTGDTVQGHPPMRVHWMADSIPRNPVGRVIATRESSLRAFVADFDTHNLPDPLEILPRILDETVIGSRSTIHGDLNLENILVGPGDFVWLIDFAETRDGHPLADFAHLEAEIISHVIAPQIDSGTYLELLQASNNQSQTPNLQSLLATLHTLASRCMVDPAQSREYHLALFMACLGALKYKNLDHHQKHLLYLTSAYLAQTL